MTAPTAVRTNAVGTHRNPVPLVQRTAPRSPQHPAEERHRRHERGSADGDERIEVVRQTAGDQRRAGGDERELDPRDA
jgi:hypothetical protein